MSSPTIIDLAAERTQRHNLAERAAIGADAFVEGLQQAGITLAEFAWLLAAPVRHHDKELKHGIYRPVLTKLNTNFLTSLDKMNQPLDIRQQALDGALGIASAAYRTHLLTLSAADRSM